MSTFPVVLTRHLRTDPGRPLVTFYDDATGERVELSVATYANWVAKTSALLAEEFDVERGDRVAVDLPTHWLGPIVVGACWNLGAEVVAPDAASPAVVVSGPDGLEAHAGAGLPVLASALRPLGARFAGPLPVGVVDLGAEVWAYPDAFAPVEAPAPDDPAAYGRTQGELFGEDGQAARGTRRLTTANPASPEGVGDWATAYATGGSVVLVRHADADLWADRIETERVTAADPAPTGRD